MRQLLFRSLLVLSVALQFHAVPAMAAGGLFSKIKSLYSKSANDLQADKFATYQEFLNDVDKSCKTDCRNTLSELEKFNSSYNDRALESEIQTRSEAKDSIQVPVDAKLIQRLQGFLNKTPDSLKMRVQSSLEGIKALLHIEKNNMAHGNTAEMMEDSKFLFRQAQSLYRLQKILRNQTGKTITLSEQEARDVVSSINGLGITYVKLAQTLSSLTTEVPEHIARVLKGLGAENTELTAQMARETLRKEWTFNPSDIFRNLDLSKPLSTGSLGYTYTAELQNTRGEWVPVVIKVQRPDLEASLQKSRKFHDMFLKFSQAAISHLDLSPILSLVTDQIMGVEKSIQNEMDYRREAKNMERFADYFKNNKEVIVPKVFTEYSTAKVLVMEQAQGQTLDVNLRKIFAAYEAKGSDPKSVEGRSIEKTYSLLVENLTYMFLITKEMHADLRPENILTTLQQDEKGLSLKPQMTVLDYGSTIETKGLILNPAFAGLHLLTGNAEGFTKRFLQIGTSGKSPEEILQVVERAFAKHGVKKINVVTFLKQGGRFNNLLALRNALLDIASESIKDHGYRPDPRYMETGRTLVPAGITLWTLGRRLDGLTLVKASMFAVSKAVIKGSIAQIPKLLTAKKTQLLAPRCEAIFR